MAETVIVGCKLPTGLVLEIDELHKDQPTIGSTGGTADLWRPSGRKVVLTGAQANSTRSASPGRVVAGYGLTEVPKDFWDEWVRQHKGFPWLTNGTIFAQPTPDRATSQAREQSGHLLLRHQQQPWPLRDPGLGNSPQMSLAGSR